jgi:hypothetical protein
MTDWVVTCNASIVLKTAEPYIQLTSMEFDTSKNAVEPVVGRLIQSKYRRRSNELQRKRYLFNL